MPVSFSSFFFQTMKFLWTLTRLWSHMDLALKELGWLLDQTLDFLHKVIGKADADFSLLIRNKVEQSKGWCLLLHSIAQMKEGHRRIYINHTEALWDCNSFLLLCDLVSNHRSIASLAGRCAILLTLAQASLALERSLLQLPVRRNFFFKFYIWNSRSRWPGEIPRKTKLIHKKGFMWTTYTWGSVQKVVLNACLSQKAGLGITVKSNVNWPRSQNLSLCWWLGLV